MVAEFARRGRSPLRLSCLVALPAALALAVQLPGCATYEAAGFVDEGGASTLVDHAEQEGLHVAVRNLAPERRSVTHFDRDLESAGFVPVMLLLETDVSSDDAFNLRRRDVTLVLRDGTRLAPVDYTEVLDSVAYSHWRTCFGFLLIIPGFVIWPSVDEANRQMELDYESKALRSVRISPNRRSYRGVVFFAVGEEIEEGFTLEDAFVEVVAYREGDRDGDGSIGKRLEFAAHFSE